MNEEKDLVSIIMPVYNGENFIETTLKDIKKQTYSNWELICVNDGSTDKTYEIIKEASIDNSRIKILNMNHIGAGAARNIGFESSLGEYVIFLDSDDNYESTLIETMYNTAKKVNADLCICDFKVYDLSSNKEMEKKNDVPSEPFSLKQLNDNAFCDCAVSPWNKLIKRKLIIDNNIQFQNFSSSNDLFFSCMVLLKAKRIINVHNSNLIIHKINREGQISGNRNPINHLNATKSLMEKIKDEKSIRKIIELMVISGLSELNRCSNEENRKRFYTELVDYINDEEKIIKSASERQIKIINIYKRYPYESKWWSTIDLFYYNQLKDNRNVLIEIMKKINKPILWGCGNRAKAFIKFINQENIRIYGITDRNIENAKRLKKELKIENVIYSNEEAIANAESIIASNEKIYESLIKKDYDFPLINLEKYCQDL